MPMHDWSRVQSGVYHNFHVLWLSAITNCLNAGLLPAGMFAMAEQIIGGPEPDVVTLQQNDGGFSAGSVDAATLTEAPPQPQTQFVIPIEVERYAAKANRVVVRHSLGKVVAIVELVSPGNKDSRHALRSFVEKTVGLLFDDINLLVIDPFPPGPRDPQGIHKAIWDEISDEPFELPDDRKLTLAAYQTAPVKTAYVEPFTVGKPIPDMPLFLHNNFYINVPLEATYMQTWSVLPQLLRELVDRRLWHRLPGCGFRKPTTALTLQAMQGQITMVSVTNRRFTIDEYELLIEKGILTENDRVELIRGEIVEKMVIGPSHIACVNRLTNLLVSRLSGRTIVSVQNPIVLTDSVPEPDLALLIPRDDFYASAKPKASDVQLVIEVANSSLAYDQQIKLPLYAQAGIEECWIINLEQAQVEVYRQPQADGRYTTRTDYARADSLRTLAFPDVVLTIAAILG